MTIPELLRKFLAERDALAPFERNVHRQRGLRVNPIDIESAFDWSETPEGFDYWNQLSAEYAAEINKITARPFYGDDDGRAD